MRKQFHVFGASVVLLALGCADAPLSPDLPETAVKSAPAYRMAYDLSYNCSDALVDPGTVKVVNGVFIQRKTVFHCPLSGDLVGVMVVVQNLTIWNLGTPQMAGRVFATTELMIDEFFGRTDLEGTFKGPSNSSLEDLLVGEFAVHRQGTGDFQGWVMQGVDSQFPPGSAIVNETGEIFGNTVP